MMSWKKRMMDEKRVLLEITFLCWIVTIHASSGWLNKLNPVEPHLCTNTSDCDQSTGQICFHLYESCPEGQCMCDLTSRLVPFNDVSAKCVPMSVGMEPCSSDALCPDEMACRGGFCRCKNGKITSDRLHCLRHGYAFVGDKCSQNENTCYQKTAYGYTTVDVTCSPLGICACVEGYKTNGLSCRRRKVYEYGCRKSYNCEGGAVCHDSRCICPNGYYAPKGSFKCVRNGATTNVPMGGECDEINERLYCAKDLVCHKCASEQIYHCVRFLLANGYSPYNSNAADVVNLFQRSLSSAGIGAFIFAAFVTFLCHLFVLR